MASRVILGQVTGLHGLKGWLKVHSYTQPRGQLLDYPELVFGDRGKLQFEGQEHGNRILLRPGSVDDRTGAEPFVGCELWLERQDLPPAAHGEYYWHDLEGCQVVNGGGQALGTVRRMMATGAHDVMVLEGDRQRLVPFAMDRVVKDVDLDKRRIEVDWDADW